MSSETQPYIAGWHEVVGFPEWGVHAVRAKLDTGAKTSAVHAENIAVMPAGPAGEERVRFDLVLHNRPPHTTRPVEAAVVRRTAVKSSNGQLDTRFVVETTLSIGPISFPAEFTLVSRQDMRFRVLLGRRALAHGIVVDSAREYLLTDPPKKHRRSPRS
ncbi:MAG: ATP-dependent zinc protease family protein [Phycisphaerales bacterium]